MESKSTTQTLATILFSAILHTALLVIIIGIPVRQFFVAHDPEALEYQKFSTQQHKPAQRSASRPAISHDLEDIAAPTPAPIKAAAVKKAVKPQAEKIEAKQEKKPKIIDVDMTKDDDQDQDQATEDKSDETAKSEASSIEKVKPEAEATEEEAAPATTTESKAKDVLPQDGVEKSSSQLKPVTDKIAGVQAADDDDKTEATAEEANPPAPEDATPADGQ